MTSVLWAEELADELGLAGVAFGTTSGLGRGRWIRIGRGGLGSSSGQKGHILKSRGTPGEVAR